MSSATSHKVLMPLSFKIFMPLGVPSLNTNFWTLPPNIVSCIRGWVPPCFTFITLAFSTSSANAQWWLLWSNRPHNGVFVTRILKFYNLCRSLDVSHELLTCPVSFPLSTILEQHPCGFWEIWIPWFGKCILIVIKSQETRVTIDKDSP